jgi:hypothetical protein
MLDAVSHTCNPSYSEDGDEEDHISSPAYTKKVSKTPPHTSKSRLVEVGHKRGTNCTGVVGRMIMKPHLKNN